MAECQRVVLISNDMKVTITPTGKHGGLSSVEGGAVIIENMVYKAHVLHLK